MSNRLDSKSTTELIKFNLQIIYSGFFFLVRLKYYDQCGLMLREMK